MKGAGYLHATLSRPNACLGAKLHCFVERISDLLARTSICFLGACQASPMCVCKCDSANGM